MSTPTPTLKSVSLTGVEKSCLINLNLTVFLALAFIIWNDMLPPSLWIYESWTAFNGKIAIIASLLVNFLVFK